MGMFDNIKKKAADAVDQHGDKIGKGLDAAGGAAKKRSGGKHGGQIDSGVDKAKQALDGLDGRDDDIPGGRDTPRGGPQRPDEPR